VSAEGRSRQQAMLDRARPSLFTATAAAYSVSPLPVHSEGRVFTPRLPSPTPAIHSNGRVFTAVLYLQESWADDHGGCTRIFPPQLEGDEENEGSGGRSMRREEGAGMAGEKRSEKAQMQREAAVAVETAEWEERNESWGRCGVGDGSSSGIVEGDRRDSKASPGTRDGALPTAGSAVADVRAPRCRKEASNGPHTFLLPRQWRSHFPHLFRGAGRDPSKPCMSLLL
jgi:hypothetical protein